LAIKTIEASTEKRVSVSDYQRSILLLDLSGDKRAANAWASERFPDSNIQLINKADLKWESKRTALARVRALKPDTFAVFTADLDLQSARSALLLFSALAGASRVVIEDRAGRSVSRSRVGAFLIEAPRYALEIAIGYGVIIPISWLLTLLLRAMLPFRKIVRDSKKAERSKSADRAASRKALHIRATLASSTEGGMSTHVEGFTSGAADAGHRLTFLSVGVREKQPSHESDQVRHVSKPSAALSATRAIFELWNNLIFTFNSLRLVKRESIAPDSLDFIYQRYSRFNFTGVALSLATGLPLALEYNGSEVWISRRWDPVGQLWLLKEFERLNQIAADSIFVVSEAERRNLVREGIHTNRIIVNPNGVDTNLFRPGKGRERIRKMLGIDDRIVAGFLGTFGPWHGAPVLAEAATKSSGASGCHFLFIGDGDQRTLSESIIERGGASAITTFTGRIPHPEVPDYLDACDILISPHVESDDGSEFFGSPTKLFEYMATARPVVASRLGQLAEIIIDGENGLLVEPGDADALARAIERLAKDEALRERLGAAARQTVIEQYTWRQNAARVFDAMNPQL
jgi:glycosyltransferase involved in cell wall biosynthesis